MAKLFILNKPYITTLQCRHMQPSWAVQFPRSVPPHPERKESGVILSCPGSVVPHISSFLFDGQRSASLVDAFACFSHFWLHDRPTCQPVKHCSFSRSTSEGRVFAHSVVQLFRLPPPSTDSRTRFLRAGRAAPCARSVRCRGGTRHRLAMQVTVLPALVTEGNINANQYPRRLSLHSHVPPFWEPRRSNPHCVESHCGVTRY